MPEGPSLVILKEELAAFTGKKVLKAEGTATKIDIAALEGKRSAASKPGKHLLICFPGFAIRVHLMLFGTYRINERKENVKPMLSLQFAAGKEINFYTCSLRRVEYPLDETYDWSEDIMSPEWDEKKALDKLKKIPKKRWYGDAFAGSAYFFRVR